jgi:hypothetical protein
MSETSTRWWESPTKDLPASFMRDRNAAESSRLELLLDVPREVAKDDLLIRIRRAATLLEIYALESEGGIKSKRTWEMIALIYETIGVIDSVKQNRYWLLAALAWQLAEAPSIAGLLALRLFRHDVSSTKDVFDQMAMAFSMRSFDDLNVIADAAAKKGEQLRAAAHDSGELTDVINGTMLLAVGGCMRDLARYVLFEDNTLPSLSGLEDFVELARLVGDSRRFRVGRLLLACIRRFEQTSSRSLVEQIQNVSENSKRRIHEYLRQYPELWPSQQDAIEQGLLDRSKRHFVVAVPTSSGKTLCGELAIIQELTDRYATACFYVVPTRALVTEKSDELQIKMRRFKFRVAAATGALQRDDVEDSHLSNAQLIVCTPEKLDLLIRHEHTSLKSANLFIIDETQMISDNDRGLGLEFVVVKLLLLYPNARILMLSAMLPNAEEFGRWLSIDAVVSSPDWRPTRQRFGEIKFQKKRPRGSSLEMDLYDTADGLQEMQLVVREYSRQPKSGLEKVANRQRLG